MLSFGAGVPFLIATEHQGTMCPPTGQDQDTRTMGAVDATLVMSHDKSVIHTIHNQARCCRTVGGDNNRVNNSVSLCILTGP